MIDDIFTLVEADLIKDIPLLWCEAEDSLFWPFTNNGIYNSKSGYRFLKAEKQAKLDEQQRLKDKQLWRTLWSMQVPNKIKNLVWMACRNSLPTKENLVRCTIIDNPICDRCKLVPESSLHALWSCGELDVIWEGGSLWQCRRNRIYMDLKELLSWLITNQQDLELFSTLTWLIWTKRNQVCLNKPSISSHLLAATANELVAEFALTVPLPPYPRLVANSTQTRWRPPTQGMVKINCDGATFRDQNKSGIGVVIRDDNGMVLASMSKQLPQLYSALEVEAMATSTALSFAS